MKWKVGDVAIIAYPIDHVELRGKEVLIIGPLRLYCDFDDWEKQNPMLAYEVLIDDEIWYSEHSELRPIPPLEEKGSWDDCVFKPKELVRILT